MLPSQQCLKIRCEGLSDCIDIAYNHGVILIPYFSKLQITCSMASIVKLHKTCSKQFSLTS